MDNNNEATPEPDDDRVASAARGASYRERIRTAEAERDAAIGRLGVAQRREINAVAGRHLAIPDDLFDIGGVAIDSLLDDDGQVNAEKVGSACKELLGNRPGLKAVFKKGGPNGGSPNFDGGARGSLHPARAGWQDVLRGTGGGR